MTYLVSSSSLFFVVVVVVVFNCYFAVIVKRLEPEARRYKKYSNQAINQSSLKRLLHTKSQAILLSHYNFFFVETGY